METMFAAAYDDLRRLARARLSAGGRDAVLDTTALVHDSFLRLSGLGKTRPVDRVHFLRYASRVMRSVIVDGVRRRQAERRGGDAEHIALTTRLGDRLDCGEREILRVHEALDELARLDARLAQVVEMRYFAGMTEGEIGQALDLSERTVRRDWEKARLLLSKALEN
jgi:RNA polymerase sigma factor (TIGR02999 family)